jgi:predicted RNA methylase
MRTAGKQKAGFYPTPNEVVELIVGHIERPFTTGAYRLLDPCCGTGEALQILSSRLGISGTYGVELDGERAKQAGLVLKQALSGSFESMRSIWNGFSLLFLNPPYDADEETTRLEHKFLSKMTPYLRPDGLLVFIIVQKNLIKETARFLSSHYQNIKAYRFPDPQFERFNQIVLFASKRTPAIRDSYAEAQLNELARKPAKELSILKSSPRAIYRLPEGASNFAFYSEDIDPRLVLGEVRESGLFSEGRTRDMIFPESLPALKPLMPLRKGHLAMLISAGYLNNTLLEYKGRKLLIKGRCTKEQIKFQEDREGMEILIERDVIKTTIKGLVLETGELITIE